MELLLSTQRGRIRILASVRRYFFPFLLIVSFVFVLVSTVLSVYWARKWPVVGDAALMRSVVWMLHSGRAPYSQIVDINLPGSYLLEAASMDVFGVMAVGLRLYDGMLCLIVCVFSALLAGGGWRQRLCGVTAGLLFALIHLHDGVVQAGQRDLAMAAILVAALAVLLRSPARVRPLARACVYELLIGFTLTIKPVLLPLVLLPVLDSYLRGERWGLNLRRFALGLLFAFLPALLVGVWLLQANSLQAFLDVVHLVSVSHAALARKGFVFLLVHATAPIAPIAAFALVSRIGDGPIGREGKLLLFAGGAGLLGFVLQHKGFPYHRYPFLVLVLLVSFRLIAVGLEGSLARQAAAGVAIVFGCLWLAPKFARDIRGYAWDAPFETHLAADLGRLGAKQTEVQCLDMVGGCIATLNGLGLMQSTGFLYDCYAYVGPDSERDRYRAAFLGALDSAKPRLIVLTSQFCLGAGEDIGRVARWAALERMLKQHYGVDAGWHPERSIRWWSQSELPPSYEIFVRRDSMGVERGHPARMQGYRLRETQIPLGKGTVKDVKPRT